MCHLSSMHYILYRQLRNTSHGQILINISISLICLYLVFLMGAHSAPLPVLCSISAALLQYFMLVFFGWTAVEAFFLYRNLVQVLVSNIPKFTLKAGLIIWSKLIILSNIDLATYYISCSNFVTNCGGFCWSRLQRLLHQ